MMCVISQSVPRCLADLLRDARPPSAGQTCNCVTGAVENHCTVCLTEVCHLLGERGGQLFLFFLTAAFKVDLMLSAITGWYCESKDGIY